MKALITLTFVAASCAILSYAGALPATNIMSPACFAVAFILALLHLMIRQRSPIPIQRGNVGWFRQFLSSLIANAGRDSGRLGLSTTRTTQFL
jgi:hypothetical protein